MPGLPNPEGGFFPGSEKIYTPEKVAEVLNKAVAILLENEYISLDGELAEALYRQGITTSISTLRNILNKYNTNDIEHYKSDIEQILEYRKCKDKKMYPGIAAMALKNKHNWHDGQRVDIGGQENNPITLKVIIDREGTISPPAS